MKKVFNTTLIIACATFGVVGAIKKYKHVFLTRPTFINASAQPEVLAVVPPVLAEGALALPALDKLPSIDRMSLLFATHGEVFPIVQTISFSPKVQWLEGKLAWVADYATHFQTSRHFIARSLNGCPDYFSQTVSHGSRFNVYNSERPFDFHLVVDLSTCQMALYYFDQTTDERILLKTYTVGVGRQDDACSLTPLGTFKIGSKVAIYKPGVMGTFQDQKVEMIRIFGSRWLPLETLDAQNKVLSRGIGLHGLPWRDTEDGEHLQEDVSSIGSYSSDGCIRLAKNDIEELFAVVITKPCFVHVVNHLQEADLPGHEVVQPTH